MISRGRGKGNFRQGKKVVDGRKEREERYWVYGIVYSSTRLVIGWRRVDRLKSVWYSGTDEVGEKRSCKRVEVSRQRKVRLGLGR